MEGLLILIGIWVLDVVIKKVAANRKKRQQQPPQYQPDGDENDGYEPQEEAQEQLPPRSLQDLIRQFEEAQQQASQGNIEPPTPPVEPRRDPNKPLSLRDIAEVVIGVDFIDLQFLMEEFEVDENTAAEMMMALQAYRIVGHDMGEGTCDVLVHDMDEVDNLLNRALRRAQGPDEAELQEQEDSRKKEIEAEQEKARRQEQEQQRLAERQRELNELEERAKAARESAAAVENFAGAESPDGTAPAAHRKPAVSAKSIADVRRGFIWAKVLDEPRFKRRWSARYR